MGLTMGTSGWCHSPAVKVHLTRTELAIVHVAGNRRSTPAPGESSHRVVTTFDLV
jgi:hypothetical protein